MHFYRISAAMAKFDASPAELVNALKSPESYDASNSPFTVINILPIIRKELDVLSEQLDAFFPHVACRMTCPTHNLVEVECIFQPAPPGSTVPPECTDQVFVVPTFVASASCPHKGCGRHLSIGPESQFVFRKCTVLVVRCDTTNAAVFKAEKEKAEQDLVLLNNYKDIGTQLDSKRKEMIARGQEAQRRCVADEGLGAFIVSEIHTRGNTLSKLKSQLVQGKRGSYVGHNTTIDDDIRECKKFIKRSNLFKVETFSDCKLKQADGVMSLASGSQLLPLRGTYKIDAQSHSPYIVSRSYGGYVPKASSLLADNAKFCDVIMIFMMSSSPNMG